MPKQKKLYYKELYIDIFPSIIHIFFGPLHLMNRKLSSLGLEQIEKGDYQALTCQEARNNEHIFYAPTLHIKDRVIVHEAMHLTHYILSRKGLPLVDDSQEAYCYLVDHIFDVIQRFIKENV